MIPFDIFCYHILPYTDVTSLMCLGKSYEKFCRKYMLQMVVKITEDSGYVSDMFRSHSLQCNEIKKLVVPMYKMLLNQDHTLSLYDFDICKLVYSKNPTRVKYSTMCSHSDFNIICEINIQTMVPFAETIVNNTYLDEECVENSKCKCHDCVFKVAILRTGE